MWQHHILPLATAFSRWQLCQTSKDLKKWAEDVPVFIDVKVRRMDLAGSMLDELTVAQCEWATETKQWFGIRALVSYLKPRDCVKLLAQNINRIGHGDPAILLSVLCAEKVIHNFDILLIYFASGQHIPNMTPQGNELVNWSLIRKEPLGALVDEACLHAKDGATLDWFLGLPEPEDWRSYEPNYLHFLSAYEKSPQTALRLIKHSAKGSNFLQQNAIRLFIGDLLSPTKSYHVTWSTILQLTKSSLYGFPCKADLRGQGLVEGQLRSALFFAMRADEERFVFLANVYDKTDVFSYQWQKQWVKQIIASPDELITPLSAQPWFDSLRHLRGTRHPERNCLVVREDSLVVHLSEAGDDATFPLTLLILLDVVGGYFKK
jgi:hypothetical protein